jgi:hypothetical protein
MLNLKTLQQPLLGELAMSRKKEEERERERERRKKMPPTFMPAAKGGARTPLGPKFAC